MNPGHFRVSQMNIDSSGQRFRSLVENALDFLNKAIGELKDGPKYSVIHFYAAVELFHGARAWLRSLPNGMPWAGKPN